MNERYEFNIDQLSIPYDTLFKDKRVNHAQKFLIAIIHRLDHDMRHCYASNEYLAEALNMSESYVANSLSRLKETGWVIQVDKGDGERHLTTLLGKEKRRTQALLESENGASRIREEGLLESENINNSEDELRKEKREELQPTQPSELQDLEFVSNGARVELNPLSVFKEFFPLYRPNVVQLNLMEVEVQDLELWRTTCKFWVSMGYEGRKMPLLLDCYKNKTALKKYEGNGNKPTERIVLNDFDHCPSCDAGFKDECFMHGNKNNGTSTQ